MCDTFSADRDAWERMKWTPLSGQFRGLLKVH
jgi:hypothetical protein